MLKKKSFYIATLILGACLIGLSFLFNTEDVKAVAGICIGIGAGLTGMSIANLIMKHMERNKPEAAKWSEIEYKDERNTLIRNKAKAKAGDITQWLIIAVSFLSILGNAPLWLTLSFIAVYLIYSVLGICFMSRYQKEM